MEKKLYNNEKNLLIKDLCGRLPYGVKVRHEHLSKIGILYEISMCGDITIDYGTYNHFGNINDTKPYLFPLSSMTEEQKEDLLLTIVGKEGLKLFSVTKDGIISNDKAEQSFENFSLNSINFSNKNIETYIDWLNKNHFDYRGLIEKSLALDATNLNIY